MVAVYFPVLAISGGMILIYEGPTARMLSNLKGQLFWKETTTLGDVVSQ